MNSTYGSQDGQSLLFNYSAPADTPQRAAGMISSATQPPGCHPQIPNSSERLMSPLAALFTTMSGHLRWMNPVTTLLPGCNHDHQRSELSQAISVTWYAQGQQRESQGQGPLTPRQTLTTNPNQQAAHLVSIDSEFIPTPTLIMPLPYLLSAIVLCWQGE